MGMIFRFSLSRGCGICFSFDEAILLSIDNITFSKIHSKLFNLQDYVRSAAVRVFFSSDSGVIANQPW